MIEEYSKVLIGEEKIKEDGSTTRKAGLISMIVGGCDSYQALLSLGELTILVNNGIVYRINVADMFPQEVQMTIYYRDTTKGAIYQVGYDRDLAIQLMNRISILSMSGNETPVYYSEDFSQNELFQEMRNGKITDGQFKFILDSNCDFRIIIMLYKGIFNMNKADKISLLIYDKSYTFNAPNGTYLEFVFHLYKKKINRIYDITFLALNLWKDRRIL